MESWIKTINCNPKNEEEVIIADTEGNVTIAVFWEDDEIFMNEVNQEWTLNEVPYWMYMPRHPSEQ